MEKLPYQEVDRGMGQLMDRPEIAYVLPPGIRRSSAIDCWGHGRWAVSVLLQRGQSLAVQISSHHRPSDYLALLTLRITRSVINCWIVPSQLDASSFHNMDV
jgi:hypothetical protein